MSSYRFDPLNGTLQVFMSIIDIVGDLTFYDEGHTHYFYIEEASREYANHWECRCKIDDCSARISFDYKKLQEMRREMRECK